MIRRHGAAHAGCFGETDTTVATRLPVELDRLLPLAGGSCAPPLDQRSLCIGLS